MALIPIVDRNDNIIGYKERSERLPEETFRITALWLTNSRAEILLARRSLTRKSDPGKWGMAASGHVEKGETYKSNIIKEAFEEIGLKDINPKLGPKMRPTHEHNHFSQWFILNVDMDLREFKIDPIEVAELKWISKDDLLEDLKVHPDEYISGMSLILNEIYR